MIVTLNNARIEWDGPRAWLLCRRCRPFALAGVPSVRQHAKAFEPVEKFESLPEAFTAALRLGLAMPGEPMDLGPMNRLLRLLADLAAPELPAIGHGYWLERKSGSVLLWYRGERSTKPRLVRLCHTARQAVAEAAWDHAGRMHVTLPVTDLGELLAGIVGELLGQPAAEAADAVQSAQGS